MRFFILDDNMNVILILKKIIKDKELGTVVGEETDGIKGMENIRATLPDIVLIDLLMPEVDGLNIVKDLKEEYPNMEFIMISQVSSKSMVEKAYKVGVEYYICKPINAIEVQSIIEKVIERIQINKTISQMHQIFNKVPVKEQIKRPIKEEQSPEKCINNVLKNLGIIGEKGSQDIIAIMNYVIKNGIDLNKTTIREICSKITDNPKSIEQRMRRAINIAMSNIASLGLEDYMNETFTQYSNTLFNFEQVRLEMEFIRGNAPKGGSTNIKKFLLGLKVYCENLNN